MRYLAVVAMVIVVVVVGCGSPAEPGSAAPGSTVDVRVDVVGDQVSGPGPRIEVARGDLLRLTVRSDRADELHVHGYDRTLQLPAGADATLELVTDLPGVFEVELHGSGTVLPSLEVR